MQRDIASFVESSRFNNAIMALILLNAVTLGLETSPSIYAAYGTLLLTIDTIIIVIFTAELLAKFYAYRWSFFRSGWNIFDLAIVLISWAPASGPFAVLRSLRILRVLRLISVAPSLRRVVVAVGEAIPGMTSVIAVLCIVFYVSAVLATNLFGAHPSPEMQEWFGTIGASAYTLFQIMTLESWSMGIVRPVMVHYPWAWAFFVPFIFITTFAVLNLFIGIIVDAMQASHRDEAHQESEDLKQHTHDEIAALHRRFDQLEERLSAVLAQQGGPEPGSRRERE